jgi:hypothetical protein
MDVGTARQWGDAGISPKQLRTMVQRGELVRLRYGVYASASALALAADDKALRHALEVRAALAATSSSAAVASHESAALVHGLPLLREPPAGTVSLTRSPGASTGRSATGLRVYSATLPGEHVTTVGGVRVTTVARTAIDLARALPFMDAVVVADAAARWRAGGRPRLRGLLTGRGNAGATSNTSLSFSLYRRVRPSQAVPGPERAWSAVKRAGETGVTNGMRGWRG